MTESNKYFIAIVPDDPIKSQVHDFKVHCEQYYNSRAALKSPPHITLFMPFLWEEKRNEKLFTVLKETGVQYQPFDLRLKNFSAFAPRVIFVDVIENQKLQMLQKYLMKNLKRQLHIIDKGYDKRPFHPHLTIAFRDLKKEYFKKAWEEEFQSKKYDATFTVKEITLLKHNGKIWEAYFKFPLIKS